MTQAYEAADAISDSKFGPMLGKRRVDLSALTEDFVSPYKRHRNFIVTIFQLAASGDSTLNYVDALGNDHSENFTAVGQVITGGPPGSAHPIPMLCSRIKRTNTTVRQVEVSW